jgi:hypothetical protein
MRFYDAEFLWGEEVDGWVEVGYCLFEGFPTDKVHTSKERDLQDKVFFLFSTFQKKENLLLTNE